MHRTTLLILGLLLSGGTSHVEADTIRLKNGSVIEGKIVEYHTNPGIVILPVLDGQSVNGTITIPLAEIADIADTTQHDDATITPASEAERDETKQIFQERGERMGIIAAEQRRYAHERKLEAIRYSILLEKELLLGIVLKPVINVSGGGVDTEALAEGLAGFQPYQVQLVNQ